jgi:hypothetical protein
VRVGGEMEGVSGVLGGLSGTEMVALREDMGGKWGFLGRESEGKPW